MNDVLSYMIYGLVVLAGSSPLEPGIEGRWIREAMPVGACGGDREGSLDVTLRGFTLGETRCDFGGVLPAGVQAVGGEVACRGEGEAFRSEVRVMHAAGPPDRPGDERVFVSFRGTRPSGYRRC